MLIIEMKNIEILENLKSFEKQKCRSIFFLQIIPISLRIILLFLSNYNSSKKKNLLFFLVNNSSTKSF